MSDVVNATSIQASPQPRGRKRAPRGLLVAAGLCALLVLMPLAFTVYRAVTYGWDDALELIFRPLVGELLINTLSITISATLVSAVVGTATAWFIERTRVPGRRFWAVLTVAPLAMPAFITSYAWVSLSLDLQDFAGALLVISTAYFPLVYLPVAAALRGMDPALEETARSLGCGRTGVFVRVVLPQLRPALLGGMLLVALGVLSEFGAFTLLRFRTFTTQIYAEYRTSFDSSGASVFACILIAMCLLCLALEMRVRGGARYERVDRGVRRAALRYDLGHWRWIVAAGFAALAIVTLGVPIGMIGFWLTQTGAAAITPAEVSPALLVESTLSSLGYGFAAAIVTTLACVPLAFLLVRFPSRVATMFERTVFLAQGLPSLVVALAIVSLAVHALRPLYQSATLLVVAYAILFLPLALVSVRAAFTQAQPRLEETARSLGLGWRETVRRVVLPLAGPGLGAGATMVFISVVTELNSTLLLSPIGTRTLATQVWIDTSTLAFAAAAPYAALLVGISLLASGTLFALLGRSAVAGRAGDIKAGLQINVQAGSPSDK
ncbi:MULTISPECIES: ABC transporter permease [Burkholderiaceae]|uniref:Ferric iron ABC transporter, permease protein n=1 Tax=Caballeronia sordidicola TaxID=196367 RepID=A0A242MPE1_CABSO|nr:MULTISPECIES: iron ABC transporter permease [Burkholderiaceae]AME25966.1 iron ABC transporter permease [Burkholderia sp. PAMC 26561]OTP72634.1 Ferric iron ABC transporter, permease protein [Caballeronia sordidicola]